MTEYHVDVQNPDDAERLVNWLNRTRSLGVDPANGTVVGFNQAAFDWLADQEEEPSFRIDVGLGGRPLLWIENEVDFPVERVAP